MSKSSNLATALRLMYDTKRFNRIYQNKGYSNNSNNANTYLLNIAGKSTPVNIRMFNGDFNMFYEVLYEKIYTLPTHLVSNPEVVLDLGANVGFASLFFADAYPDAKIIAVEPSASNFEQLQKNTASFSRISPIQAAIYPTSDNVPFVEDNLAYNSKIGVGNGTSYMVNAITIPEILSVHDIAEVDLMKMDIEGAEEMLLAENTEWLHKVKCIIVELHHPYNIENFVQDLKPFNFKVYKPEELGTKMIVAIKQ